MAVNYAENYEKDNIFNLNEYNNKIDNFDFDGTFSSLYENNAESNVVSEGKENSEYDKYPYISEQDYKKYFAPETFNFTQFIVGSCRITSAIYGITSMESYKEYIKNSVKKDTYGNFIIKLPLSKDIESEGVWYKPNLSVYQNQKTIDGTNPQVLHKEKKDEDQDSGNGIVALAMAIGEKITGRSNFDIYRLDGGYARDVLSNGNIIKDISLKEIVECDKNNNRLIDINKLKSILGQNDTIVTAGVLENDYGFLETIKGNNRKWPNHEITITKIIKEGNVEYVQYYNPNDSELRKLTVNEFQERCFIYYVFCATDKKDSNHKPYSEKRYSEKPYLNYENDNSAGIIVDYTGKPNETLRNLRGDFITYEDGGKIIVESRGKKAEITHERKPEKFSYYLQSYDKNGEPIHQDIPDEYRTISFSNSEECLHIDTSNLSKKHRGKKNDKYVEYLYLPKIANFINRMIHDYIDTEARNIKNTSPFSINKIGNLVLDDYPYNVNRDKLEKSERINIQEEWRKRMTEKERRWNDKLVCLRDRKELGINDKKTKQAIVNTLNNMVKEKIYNK